MPLRNTPKLRPQQHRLTWPLTPTQVEAIDEMLQTLFKANGPVVTAAVSTAPLAQVAARVSLHI